MDALALYRRRDYAAAAARWEALAVDAQDDDEAARHLTNAARCKLELGLSRAALKQGEEAARRCGSYVSAHVVKGRALELLKKPGKAAAAWRAGAAAATEASRYLRAGRVDAAGYIHVLDAIPKKSRSAPSTRPWPRRRRRVGGRREMPRPSRRSRCP